MVKNRIFYFEFLKVLAIIAVIFIHVAAPIIPRYYELNLNDWWTANVYDSLTRWCVPIFIMISGALLLNPKKTDSIQTFFKKRTLKVVYPLIIWSSIYLLKILIFDEQLTLKTIVIRLLEGNLYYHLWFIYIIIGLYIITPVIKIFIQNASNKEIKYFLIVWFISASIYKLVEQFTGIEIGFEIPFASGYLGYFILGYYLHNVELKVSTKYLFYILGCISLVVTIYGTYIQVIDNITSSFYFYSNLSPNIIIMSSAIFIFFKTINTQLGKQVQNIVITISKTTMGIYLIHPLVLDVLSILKINALTINPIISIPAVSVLTFAISFLVIFIMQKIPFIKRMVP